MKRHLNLLQDNQKSSWAISALQCFEALAGRGSEGSGSSGQEGPQGRDSELLTQSTENKALI